MLILKGGGGGGAATAVVEAVLVLILVAMSCLAVYLGWRHYRTRSCSAPTKLWKMYCLLTNIILCNEHSEL